MYAMQDSLERTLVQIIERRLAYERAGAELPPALATTAIAVRFGISEIQVEQELNDAREIRIPHVH